MLMLVVMYKSSCVCVVEVSEVLLSLLRLSILIKSHPMRTPSALPLLESQWKTMKIGRFLYNFCDGIVYSELYHAVDDGVCESICKILSPNKAGKLESNIRSLELSRVSAP